MAAGNGFVPMGPPSMIPVKRAAPGGGGGGGVAASDAKKPRVSIPEDLPDEISQQDIQQMLDAADDVHVETLNEAGLKRLVLQLDRKIKTNQSLRIKHSDDPDKFLKSEVDLDEEVKKFTQLGAHPELYGELVKLEGIPRLVGLLNHVNTDIAVDVFEVLSELTDPDVISEVPEADEFVKALFEADLCQMTVDTLSRIDESVSEEDAKAVTNCLTMIENLADINPTETCKQIVAVGKLLPWLIKRVRSQGNVDYNKVYAAEILGIVLQQSSQARETMIELEGVDKLLRGIAAYRKKDPNDSEESEYVQNMFDCLCTLMLLPPHQIAFGKAQGLELMIRMMRQRNFSSPLALRLADHATRHCQVNCQIFVEKLGLPVLFPFFMKKGPKTKSKAEAREQEEHVTSIIQSLCRFCTGTAVARVLNKFMENNFEKLERLMEMHEEFTRSVKRADELRSAGQVQSIDRDLEVDDEEQLYLDRCDAGLFTLQQVDIIIVRLASMGNRQATEEIGKLLNIKGVPVVEICQILSEYCSHLDDSAAEERKQLQKLGVSMAKRCASDDEEAKELEMVVLGTSNGIKGGPLPQAGEDDATKAQADDAPDWGQGSDGEEAADEEAQASD